MTDRRGILSPMDHSPAAEFVHLAVASELFDLHHEMDLLLATARTRGVNTVVEVVPPFHLDAPTPDRTPMDEELRADAGRVRATGDSVLAQAIDALLDHILFAERAWMDAWVDDLEMVAEAVSRWVPPTGPDGQQVTGVRWVWSEDDRDAWRRCPAVERMSSRPEGFHSVDLVHDPEIVLPAGVIDTVVLTVEHGPEIVSLEPFGTYRSVADVLDSLAVAHQVLGDALGWC